MNSSTHLKILCVFGEHNYGDPQRGQGYEFTNFLPAIRNLGHQVQFFESFNRNAHEDFEALNRALLERIDQFRPDVVFFVLMGYEVWLETLTLIRQSGIRTVNWGTDDSWKYQQFSRFVAPALDLWVTTSHRAWERSRRDGMQHVVLSQWAARRDALVEPLPASVCRYPVSFVGSSYGNRPQWIAGLNARGLDVACFGYGWPAGAIVAQDIPRIVRESVVSLNFGDSGLQFEGLRPFRSRQIKARVFEVPGAGGCLLTEPAEHLEDYYDPGREIEVFMDVDELARKIRHLISHPEQRDAMAMAGYRRTLENHTYEARFKEVFDQLTLPVSKGQIDFMEFERVAAQYRTGKMSHAFRWLLSFPFRLVWGDVRGSRAARRFMFELSWRVCGKRTYTASGWPGRLFYHES